MPNHLSPGVYVQEHPDTGANTIVRKSTNVAGFVGVAPNPDARPDEAVAVENWTHFVGVFVGESDHGTHLANAVFGFFSNGGDRCYVVNIGSGSAITGTARKQTGLDLFDAIDDISIVAAPGFADATAYAALQAHCEAPLRQDRMAILDTPEHVSDISALTRTATSGMPMQAPDGNPEDGETVEGGATRRAPAEASSSDACGAPQSSYLAVYYPWIVVNDAVTGERVTQPPSGHVAGVWARVDTQRGVHKAPANEAVLGALDLVHHVSTGEQDVLNPSGVNCIRYFPANGIRMWGARTRAADEFRYINVRRLTNMIKESIEDGTRWVVVEPYDAGLWRSMGRDIRAFLTSIWRDGALVGSTPEEAFFVKCDQETNPPDVRDAGQVVALVGIATIKPAEFIIFTVKQSTGTGEPENPRA
ncbi:MAG: phage tail sheath subtilisin-like domain-containing protein [Propionibacteriaceae bacterium]|nr:phage tail sheath subtilisin-like domain-containing protein [Propionibacteriaceae bacterium]